MRRESRELALQVLFQKEFSAQINFEEFLHLYEPTTKAETRDYAHQLIEGGNGNDTIYAGTGGDTLLGGNGNDTFHIDSHTGNDTVDGCGGTNTIDFDNRSSKDIASLHTSGGQTVIHFTDGQVVNVSHVENLVFTNTTEHLH